MHPGKTILCLLSALVAVAGTYYLFSGRAGRRLAKAAVTHEPAAATATVPNATEFPKLGQIRRAVAAEMLARALDPRGKNLETGGTASLLRDDSLPESPESPELTPIEAARQAIRNGVIREYPVEQVPKLLGTMLEEQPSDLTWTTEVKNEISLAMERIGDDEGKLKEASCHEALCRIVSTHGSSAEARQFWQKAADNSVLGGPRQRFTRVLAGEQVESTCYMGRPGHDAEVHEALYNRMYKELTSKDVSEIQPTEEQIAQAMAQRNTQVPGPPTVDATRSSRQ